MSQGTISIVEAEAVADIIRTRAIKAIIISIIKAPEKENITKNPLKISILGIKNQEEIDPDLEARVMTQEEKNISRRSLALEEVDQAQDQWKWIVAIL